MLRTLGAVVLVGGVLSVFPMAASADDLPCPLAPDALIAQVVGSPVTGGMMADPTNPTQPLDTGSSTVCMWDTDAGDTIMVTREVNAFSPGETPTQLAVRKARLPAEARAEIDALREAGVSDIKVPDYQFTATGELGDPAVWVYQNEPTLDIPTGGFIVQRGADALACAVIGQTEEIARPQALKLAQAVLATLP